MKYRKKQTEVRAVQFVDGRYGEAIDFCPWLDVDFQFIGEQGKPARRSVRHAKIGGEKVVTNGDWIVKTDDNTFAVMTDTDFKAFYEADGE